VVAGLEAKLPIGVRPRQLSVRTLVLGIMLIVADARAAHLTGVHAALVGLGASEQRRLGVVVDWRGGPHTLTYRQIERTFSLLCAALAKEHPDGQPTESLQEVTDALLEASVPGTWREATTAYAVDWTDHETAARPVAVGETGSDPEASWGHRSTNGTRTEQFFGYYLSGATMVNEEDGPAVPEVCRRIVLTSCKVDPVPPLVPVLAHMVDTGVVVGDVLCDSGYSHRVPEHWALPLRQMGAACNGNLYCPATPPALLALGPLARGATAEQSAAHDVSTAELSRYKLGRIAKVDEDGFHRVMCPAAAGKLRCALRPESMRLSHDHPEIIDPPEHPPVCCSQKTITVGPDVNAKTAQKHDYPSKAHRSSFNRRTAAERTNATVKDPASIDITRGWCRVTGLSAITMLVACAFVVRNLRVVDAFDARQLDDQRRRAAGLPPKTRRRRRRSINDLVAATTANAPP
jgi:hypothetical protein